MQAKGPREGGGVAVWQCGPSTAKLCPGGLGGYLDTYSKYLST